MKIVDLAAAALSGGLLQWAAKPLWRRLSSAEREIADETHISVLRKALDKAGIRFNGVVGACDALTLAHEISKAALEEADLELPVAARRAVEIARQKLQEAVKALEGTGRG